MLTTLQPKESSSLEFHDKIESRGVADYSARNLSVVNMPLNKTQIKIDYYVPYRKKGIVY